MKESKAREVLIKFGMVRVDGLSSFSHFSNGKIELVERHPGQGYRRDNNNGKGVIVTPGGEVWLGTYPGYQTAIDTLSESGVEFMGGMFVPFSNGEQCNLSEILSRVSDPNWEK